jgi:hypothetical protein
MEEKLLRLVSQIGLLALAMWVVMAAMGMGGQMTITKPKPARKMSPHSPVWNQSPVQAPNASAGLLWSPTVVM